MELQSPASRCKRQGYDNIYSQKVVKQVRPAFLTSMTVARLPGKIPVGPKSVAINPPLARNAGQGRQPPASNDHELSHHTGIFMFQDMTMVHIGVIGILVIQHLGNELDPIMRA